MQLVVKYKDIGEHLVFSNGMIYSLWLSKFLKQTPTKKGYDRKNINGKSLRIHRLVAEIFIPNPKNLNEVNHIDGDKLNNSVENLEWCTRKENMAHAYSTGLAVNKFGQHSSRAKLTKEQVVFCKNNYIRGHVEFGQTALGKKFGVHNSTIGKIIGGSNWH